MEERLNRLEEKLDRIVESQSSIGANLQEHMRRTAIAEENIEKLAESMAPVQKHVALVQGLGSIVAWLLGIATAVATIYAAMK